MSDSVTAKLHAALAHHRAGRLRDAEMLYREILREEPRHYEAIRLLGILASDCGNSKVAIDLLSRAAQMEPQRAEVQSNLGTALQAGGQIDAAIAAYQRSLILDPSYAETYSNLCAALQAKGLLADAIAAGRKATELQPDHAEAQANLGAVLLDTGQYEEAAVFLEESVRLKPEQSRPWYNLGNAWQSLEKVDESIEAYQRALQLNPNEAVIHNNLGNAFRARAEIDRSLECFRRAVLLQPDAPDLHSNLLYSLGFHPKFEAQAILRQSMEWDRKHGQVNKAGSAPYDHDRSPNKRLRIGYVSPDFRRHVVGCNILSLLSAHNREEVEIVCYSNVAKSDEITRRIQENSDDWREIANLDDDSASAMIRADRIDILVDLALHTAGNRLPLFARKPAPIQVSYLAYCGTTGMRAMDYRLSDPYLDPIETDLSCYREQTIRLPHSYWCYEPLGETPEVSPLPASSSGKITFGCLNNFAKVSPAALELWARILSKVPASRLLLNAPQGISRRNITEYFTSHGVSESRLDFVGQQSWQGYIRSLQKIDIALDPFPYGGGITTCDALWMGIPVITLSGKTAIGRGTRSILSNVGLPELIAFTPDAYVEIALSLANDFEWLQQLRSTLRARMEASPLRDAKGHAHEIDAAFRKMWQQWLEGNPPLSDS